MYIQPWHKTKFTKVSVPDWICPECQTGLLKLLPDEITSINNYFQGLFKCPECSELVYTMGNVREENNGYHPYLTDSYIDVFEDVFTPIYFNPTVPHF